MASSLTLCSINDIDNSYDHVLKFKSKTTRRSYFYNHRIIDVSVDFKGDAFRTEILIPTTLDDVVQADYLYFRGDDNNDYFYFIDSKSYHTSDTTHLTVTLDVFTTYQFNFEFMHSFVERCHVDRFTKDGLPSFEVVDEGFNYSNYIQVAREEICEYQNSFIMTASEPLGKMPKGTGGGGDTQTKGIITKQGFRFIKGYEAFTPTGLYLNGESFRTVGYGSTEKYNSTYYDMHKPFPCSEQLASEIYAERIINEFGNRIYQELQSDGIADKINLNMFDAMCSLAYNRGVNGFLNDSTSPYLVIIKDPYDYDAIRTAWEKYAITSNGTVLNGLVKRRQAESDVYCLGEYETRSIGIYKDNGSGVGVLSGTVTSNDGNGFIPDYLPDLNGITGTVIEDEHGNTWDAPTFGSITAGYPDYPESFGGGFHGGIDFANNLDTEIRASGDGVVYSKQIYNGNEHSMPYGNLLIIEQEGNKTGQTYRVYYAHLNSFAKGIEAGVRVTKGEVIGYMGSTGNSTGEHLHYEMRVYPYSPQTDTVIHPATNLKVGMTV